MKQYRIVILLVSMLSGVVDMHAMERPNGLSLEDWKFLKRVQVPSDKKSFPCAVSGCGYISHSTSECISHGAIHAHFRLMQQRQAVAFNQSNNSGSNENVSKAR